MRTASTKKTLIILSALVIIIAAAYGYEFYDLKMRNENTSVLLNDIENQSTEDSRAGSAKNIVKDLGPDIAKLDSRIVGKDADLVAFIEYIEALGRKTGVAVKIDSVDKAEGTGAFGTVNFKISTVGTWSASYAFSSMLETVPYKLTLTSASLLTSGSSPDIPDTDGSSVWNGSYQFTVVSIQ